MALRNALVPMLSICLILAVLFILSCGFGMLKPQYCIWGNTAEGYDQDGELGRLCQDECKGSPDQTVCLSECHTRCIANECDGQLCAKCHVAYPDYNANLKQ